MLVRAVQCKQCHDYIISRSNHDFNSCKCGSLAVDGGSFSEEYKIFGFNRVIGAFQREHIVMVDLDVTPEELHEDWSTQINAYKNVNAYVTSEVADEK